MINYLNAEDHNIVGEWDQIHIWKKGEHVMLKTHRKELHMGPEASCTSIQTCDKEYIYPLIKEAVNPQFFDSLRDSYSFSMWYNKDTEDKGYFLSEVAVKKLAS